MILISEWLHDLWRLLHISVRKHLRSIPSLAAFLHEACSACRLLLSSNSSVHSPDFLLNISQSCILNVKDCMLRNCLSEIVYLRWRPSNYVKEIRFKSTCGASYNIYSVSWHITNVKCILYRCAIDVFRCSLPISSPRWTYRPLQTQKERIYEC
jgi:hypothetical protein